MHQSKYRNKIIVTVCIIIILASWLYYILRDNTEGEGGSFELLIAEVDTRVVYQETLEFNPGEKLYEVLVRNFDLICASSTYEADPSCSASFRFFDGNELVEGKVILGITGDTFQVITDWRNSYLAIEVFEENGYRLTTKGVNSYVLTDGEKIRIIVTRVSA